jgi:peptidoglycan/LPS O-acetylase OafA/YrhL
VVYTSRVFRLLPSIVLSVLLITIVIMLRTGHGLDASYVRPALRWISAQGEPPLLGYEDSGRLNAYVLWSLRIEWIFYLAFLPACALASDLLRRLGLGTWLVPVGLLALSQLDIPAAEAAFDWHFCRAFAIGMLGYECQSHPVLAQRLRSPVAAIAATLLLLLGMMAFATPYTAGLPFFGFFFVCVACGNDFGGLLSTRGALVLGECSYSIYLLHGLALDILYVDLARLVDRVFASQLALLLPGVAIAVALFTAASFLLVERPAIRLGVLIARRWKSRPILVTPHCPADDQRPLPASTAVSRRPSGSGESSQSLLAR